MGESITEATVIKWLKAVGERIDAEETLVEVATDKVDSDVPSPVSGILTEIRVAPNEIVQVGSVMALIETDGAEPIKTESREPASVVSQARPGSEVSEVQLRSNPEAFLSPLVISIAKKEQLSLEEVQSIPGSGTEGRIRKSDVFHYLQNRKYPLRRDMNAAVAPKPASGYQRPAIAFKEGSDRVVEMDRMRSMIADHMVYSKQHAPHVTSFLEVDVTGMVNWRQANRDAFAKEHGVKLTFTPLFVEAVAKAIKDFPMINVSVDGKKIIVHQDIHIGMATALPTGNLIVPVVRNAAEKDLKTIAADVNHLADAARNNKLKPDETGGSTFTISNVGTFGSLMGTPIINQPEAAILAFGTIRKRAEVITTEKGDEIAIRSMMFLSLSFDHRVIDGFLGGSFLKRVGDYMEEFNLNDVG